MRYKTVTGTKFDYRHTVGLDEDFLAEITGLGGWIGGSTALRLLDTSIIAHDIDVFCPDIKIFYTLKHFIWSHARFGGKLKDLDRYIEFSMVDTRRKYIKRTIQLVRPNIVTTSVPDTPEDILNRVDFSVSRILILNPDKMIIDEELPEHLRDRKLVFRVGVRDELDAKRALWRISKYSAKGFEVNKFDLMRILSYLNVAPREIIAMIGRAIHAQNEDFICDDALKQMYDEFMKDFLAREDSEEKKIKDDFVSITEGWQSGNAQPWKGLA